MISRRIFFGLIALFAAASAWVVAEPTPEELEQQRRRVLALRDNPEKLARLRHNLQAFQAVKPERREQILKLDEELNHEMSTDQERLWEVMRRYADWLDRLAEQDRQAIKQAPSAAARLTLIREVRDREWMSNQAKVIRDEWEKLQGEERTQFIKKLRQEDRRRREGWQFAAKFWRELEGKQPMPTKLSDFTEFKKKDDKEKPPPSKVQRYVTDYLMPMLSPQEKKELAAAEGRWPDYPQTLVRLASAHPSALPPRELPRTVAQLPPPLQSKLMDKKAFAKKLPKGLQEGPNFATKVVEYMTKSGASPFEFEFWPSTFKGLQPPMREFVEHKLVASLTRVEKADLAKVEGTWPHYPQMIQELSQKYNLQPPWHILPDAEKWKWDLYREPRPKNIVEGFPAVPQINLREFALFELNTADRQKLKLSLGDPKSYSRLVEAYYARHPQELRRLQVVDRKKRGDRLQTLSTPAKSKPGT